MPLGIGIGLSHTLTKSGLSVASYLDNVLALSPIAYWPLNETTGTNADNAAGNPDLDGTYTGVTLDNIDGPNTGERAGLWDGTDDYITIPAADLDTIWDGDDFTISLWVQLDAIGSGDDIINIETDSGDFAQLQSRTGPDGIRFIVRAGGANDAAQVDTGDAEWTDPTASWINLIATRTSSDTTIRLYLDNDGPQSNASSNGTWAGTIDNVTIGAENNTPDNPMGGHIMHIALFDRVVTSGERATLATAV